MKVRVKDLVVVDLSEQKDSVGHLLGFSGDGQNAFVGLRITVPVDRLRPFVGDDVNMVMCCSFCGKHRGEIEKLIAGVKGYICNECITICQEIITRDEPEAAA